jgi:hypothetical protein
VNRVLCWKEIPCVGRRYLVNHGVHLQHDKADIQILLLSSDYIDWNSMQNDKVGLKQGMNLGKGGMYPWSEFNIYL